MFAQWQADVFHNGQRAKQAPVLEHHTEALAQRQSRIVVQRLQIDTENPDGAGVRPLQQDDLAQQGRLAGSAAADQREYFCAAHVEAHIGMHHVLAEAGRHLVDLDDHFVGLRVAWHVTSPAC